MSYNYPASCLLLWLRRIRSSRIQQQADLQRMVSASKFDKSYWCCLLWKQWNWLNSMN